MIRSYSDPKPEGRIRNPRLLRELHVRWKCCALCGSTTNGLSLHHISRHPRDDEEGCLVMLCGSGTTGCHGRVEARDPVILRLLGEHILKARPDTIAYLYERKGVTAAQEFIRRHYMADLAEK